MSRDPLTLARSAVQLATELGAGEVQARVGRGNYTDLGYRDGALEKCQESRSLSLQVSLLVDDRFSVHSTSDLRPDALREFVGRAVEATRFLEPDPDRRLPDRQLMGVSHADIDQLDPGHAAVQPADRTAKARALEQACRDVAGDVEVRSVGTFVWDGRSESTLVCSNGFEAAEASTEFGHGAHVTVVEGDGRLPEAMWYGACRHLADLPAMETVAQQAMDRATRRVGSGSATSGRYPLLLENGSVARLLSSLIGPMQGASVHEGRSCLADRVGTRIGSERFTLVDDPTVPRGLGSNTFDGDGLPAVRRTLVEGGVLQMLLLDVYYARRLGKEPTTGSTSNLVVPPGTRSPEQIAAELATAIRVEGFMGGNTNPATGKFSFGIHGTLLENGVPVRSVSEMNVSGDIFDLLDRFVEAADDPWTFGSWRTPTLVFDGVQFSGN